LLEFAERHDAAIIEDDYDSEFRHTDRPLEPLHRLDHAGRVAYVGSFSKSLSPSLRLGFVALPDPLVESAIGWRRLLSVQPSSVGQFTLQRFIDTGQLDRHLRRVRRTYRARHEIVRRFVADAVDDGVLLPGPENHAGLHLSTILPPDVVEESVRDAARRRDIVLSSFGECCVLPDRPNGMLIGFGMADAAMLERALPELRRILERA
jgi:GntR family transcriptional regulator/MocR family aminotransferase